MKTSRIVLIVGAVVVAACVFLAIGATVVTRAHRRVVERAKNDAVADRMLESKAQMQREYDANSSSPEKTKEIRDKFYADMTQSVHQMADTKNDDQKRFAEIMEVFLKDVQKRALQWQETYVAVSNHHTLDAVDLRTEGAFEKRRLAVERYTTATNEYAIFYDQTVGEMTKRLAVLGPKNQYAIGAMEGAQDQHDKQKSFMSALMKTHGEYAAAIQAVLNHLELNIDDWEPKDGLFAFQTRTHLDEFNALVKETSTLEARIKKQTSQLIQSM